MRNHNPWTASGTATFPAHRFVFTPANDPDTVLARFIVGEYPENIYVYDPYLVEGDPEATEQNLQEHLKKKGDREKYESWRKTLSFHEQYRNFTGRSYLAHYLRDPPMHYMWPADYIGQTHWVESRETHFTRFPPSDQLKPISVQGKKRRLKDSDPRLLQEYRDPGTLNMTLRVLSVAPRVLQIDHFLSVVEVDHITELASGIKLSLSSTGDGGAGEKRVKPEEDTKTRTSYNSWVPRDKSPILDAIYRRAADLLRIDEAMFRKRDRDEIPEYDNLKTVCEDLQLVNYKETQGEQQWKNVFLWKFNGIFLMKFFSRNALCSGCCVQNTRGTYCIRRFSQLSVSCAWLVQFSLSANYACCFDAHSATTISATRESMRISKGPGLRLCW